MLPRVRGITDTKSNEMRPYESNTKVSSCFFLNAIDLCPFIVKEK